MDIDAAVPVRDESGDTKSEKGITGEGKSQVEKKETIKPDLASRRKQAAAICTGVLSKYLAYQMIPHSGKVLVFDSALNVLQAFQGLLENDMNCAPVWDSQLSRYVGMLSVTDFIDILKHVAHSSTPFEPAKQLIKDWQRIKINRGTSINRLLCISPECTLFEAVRLLIEYRIHRLCVVQLALGNTVLCVLSYHRILRFLLQHAKGLKGLVTVGESGIGNFDKNLRTITYDSPLIEAIDLLVELKLPALPIVNDKKQVVDCFTRTDTRFLAEDRVFDPTVLTVRTALHNHLRERPAVVLFTVEDDLWAACRHCVANRRYMVMVVNNHTQQQLVGTLQLPHIFQFFISGPAAPSAASTPSTNSTSSPAGAPSPNTPPPYVPLSPDTSGSSSLVDLDHSNSASTNNSPHKPSSRAIHSHNATAATAAAAAAAAAAASQSPPTFSSSSSALQPASLSPSTSPPPPPSSSPTRPVVGCRVLLRGTRGWAGQEYHATVVEASTHSVKVQFECDGGFKRYDKQDFDQLLVGQGSQHVNKAQAATAAAAAAGPGNDNAGH